MRSPEFSRLAVLAVCGLLGGCHSGLRDRHAEALRNLEASTAELESQREREQRLADRVQELEGQLALAQAESRQLRAAETARPIVRIAHQTSEWEHAATDIEVEESEPEARDAETRDDAWDDDTPRPLLRLYGTPTDPGSDYFPPPPNSTHATEAPPLILPPRPVGISDQLPVTTAVPSIHSRVPYPVISTPSVISAPVPADPGAQAYRRALALVRDRRFVEALAALQDFSANHAGHAYADNAIFWRGEVFYALRRYGDALTEFERLLAQFPGTNKTADALLKVAMCHQRLGNTARAQEGFDRVRREYPNSMAAQLAAREGST